MVYGVWFTTVCMKLFAVWETTGALESSVELVARVDGVMVSCVTA
jgi:hypothetical protein